MPVSGSDATNARCITAVIHSGSDDSGQHVKLELNFADGGRQWIEIPYSRAGVVIEAIRFGSEIAKQHRSPGTPGGQPMPELSSPQAIEGVNANAYPGADFVVLRVTLAEGVPLDFRIPLESVAPIQERLQLAVQLAQSGKPSSAH